MTKRRVVLSMVVVSLLVLALTGLVSAQGGGEPVADGFNGPMGVLVADDGTVWVIDSGLGGDETVSFPNPQTGQTEDALYGQSSRIVSITDGAQTVVGTLPSVAVGMETIGGARLALLDGVVYATSGQWVGDAASTPPIADTPSVVKIEDAEVDFVRSTYEQRV